MSRAVKRVARWILSAGVAIAMPSTGAAGPHELRVVSAPFPAVYEVASTGEFVGFGVDVLNAVCADLGCSPRFQQFPFLRALAMVDRSEADLSIGVYRTLEREGRFSFSASPLFQDELVFYGRPDSKSAWTGDYVALKSVKVGAFHGWFYGKAFEQATRERLFVPMLSYSLEEGLKQLDAGKLDVLASNRRNTDPLLIKQGLKDRLIALTPPIGLEAAWIIFPRTPLGDEWRTKIDASLARLARSGKLAALAKRHGVRLPNQ